MSRGYPSGDDPRRSTARRDILAPLLPLAGYGGFRMRARLAMLIALMTIASSVMAFNSAAWSSPGPTLAQETDEGGGQGEESEGTTPQGGAEDD